MHAVSPCRLLRRLRHINMHQAVSNPTSYLRRVERTSEPLPVALSLSQLQRAISHEGGLERLRCFLRKLRSGKERLKVAAVGGSITAMSSSVVSPSLAATYHAKVHRWLERNGGRSSRANLSHSTTAIPSIGHRDYLQHCMPLHVPRNVDLVLFDAAANLCGFESDRGTSEDKSVCA